MSKEEFLRILRIKISGAMSPSEVESQIDYYSAYIDGELMKGKSEGQIIEELGDPTLIAKTLTSAVRRADDGPEFYNSNNEYSEDTSNEQKEKSNVFQIGKAGCIIGFLIALFIIILLIVLMVKFSFAIIRFLWPVIIILLVGGLIFGLLRRR